jgi:hypothetical protein
MKTKVLSLLLVLASFNCLAQEKKTRFGVELDGNASLALQKLADTKLKVGFGFEGTFHYQFYKNFGAYTGWGWNQFVSDERKGDFEETGYVFGLQFKQTIGSSALSYYIRAGGLWNHIELENEEGDLIVDSKHGLGYQLAGGIYIPIGKNWSINTGLKFHSLKRENVAFPYDVKRTLDLKYLSLRVGIVKEF